VAEFRFNLCSLRLSAPLRQIERPQARRLKCAWGIVLSPHSHASSLTPPRSSR